MRPDRERERREILAELRSQLLALSVLARNGTALMGLGEAVNALEGALEGKKIDVNIEVEIGYRFGGEGTYASVEMDNEGVRLTTRRSEGDTINYGLDWWDFGRWRTELNAILNLDGRLSIYHDS
jgi:hypothetical protein